MSVIAELIQLRAKIEEQQAEIDRLQALHLERTKTTHRALCDRDARIAELEAVKKVAKKLSDVISADDCWGAPGWAIIALDAALAAAE